MEKIRLLINEFFRMLHIDSNGHECQKADQAERDPERVMAASRLLHMSEFRFFSLSYLQWYGREPNEESLEHIFAEYMFQNQVPHWVRHLTRRVLKSHENGSLDPAEYNPRISEPVPLEMKKAGVGYTILLAIIIVIFCIMISGYGTV
jgi:hypothetical protein